MTDERHDVDEWPPRPRARAAAPTIDGVVEAPDPIVADPVLADPVLDEAVWVEPGSEDRRADAAQARSVRTAARRRRRRRTMLVIAIVVALLVVPILAIGGWFVWQLDPPGGPGAPVTVVIEPGWGAKEAGDALADAHVIGSAFAFQVWTRLSGTSFQAGTYRLREDLGVRGAASGLAAGPDAAVADQAKLLLPPGLTLSRIADRVGALPGHSRDAFLAVATSGLVRSKYQPVGSTSLEGLTWPDTYFVGPHQTDQQILEVLVRAFDTHGDSFGLAGPNSAGLTPYQAVVSASLIQGEAAPRDQPNVSGVIVNRLRAGIPLQIDATLCYAKGGCPPAPTNADKAIDSPYNTYRVTGLPPTPILTVTESALRAALNPATHNYLFYVTGTDGVTRFAENLAGHEANIAKYGVRGE
jgi:UPF0755 protein